MTERSAGTESGSCSRKQLQLNSESVTVATDSVNFTFSLAGVLSDSALSPAAQPFN